MRNDIEGSWPPDEKPEMKGQILWLILDNHNTTQSRNE